MALYISVKSTGYQCHALKISAIGTTFKHSMVLITIDVGTDFDTNFINDGTDFDTNFINDGTDFQSPN